MFDRALKSYLQQYPDAVCVNLGCGLDSRFSRVDNGSILLSLIHIWAGGAYVPKDKHASRARIVMAARKEFLEKGFEKASMRTIAQAARCV